MSEATPISTPLLTDISSVANNVQPSFIESLMADQPQFTSIVPAFKRASSGLKAISPMIEALRSKSALRRTVTSQLVEPSVEPGVISLGALDAAHALTSNTELAWPRGGPIHAAFEALPSLDPIAAKARFEAATYRTSRGRQQLTQVYSRDYVHFTALLKERGLGETAYGSSYVRRPLTPSEHMWKGNYAQALHAAIWLAMIAQGVDAGLNRHELYDDGAIHELSHIVEDDELDRNVGRRLRHGRSPKDWSLSLLDVFEKVIAFERRVPGAHPMDGLGEEDREEWVRVQALQIEAVRQRIRARDFPVRLSDYAGLMMGTSTGIEFPYKKPFTQQTLRKPKELLKTDFDVLERKMAFAALYGSSMSGMATMQQAFNAGAVILGDMASIGGVLPDRQPTPDKRTFEMSRLSQGETAKSARIAKFMKAKADKAEPEKPKPVVVLDEVQNSKGDFVLPKGKIIIGIDPAKPGSEGMAVATLDDQTLEVKNLKITIGADA